MKPVALITALLLLATACGGDTSNPGSENRADTTVPPIDTERSTTTVGEDTSEARLLLRLDNAGGFVPVEFALAKLTDYTLFSDGRFVFAPAAEAFPGPSLNRYQEVQLDEATFTEFSQLIDELGIDGFDEIENTELSSRVADASTATAEYFDADGEMHRYSVYALGMDDFEDLDGRVEALRNLFEHARSAAESAEATSDVAIDRLNLWIGETQVDPSFHTVETWQFDLDPMTTDPAAFGYACVVLEGDEASAAAAVLDGADISTLWEESDVAYTVIAKPLLSGERGCGETAS